MPWGEKYEAVLDIEILTIDLSFASDLNVVRLGHPQRLEVNGKAVVGCCDATLSTGRELAVSWLASQNNYGHPKKPVIQIKSRRF